MALAKFIISYFYKSYLFFYSTSTLKQKWEDRDIIETEPPFNPTCYIIKDPFTNRSQIAAIAKGARGVYIFRAGKNNIHYVGSSINLYARVVSYFMPSILNNADRRILRYFKNHGFSDVTLILYILSPNSTPEMAITLEQFFIDNLKPTLNVDLIAGGSRGFQTPMSIDARLRLRKERGIAFYIYDCFSHSLIFKFDSKQFAYDTIGIDHKTLNQCLENGELYLARFLMSVEPIAELPFVSEMDILELGELVASVKIQYKSVQIKSKKLLARNIKDPSLTKIYNSIGSFASAVKGDRGTIRTYINGSRPDGSLYRGQ
jgi:GIY-YIG catalytic domain/NUMOD1 domain